MTIRLIHLDSLKAYARTIDKRELFTKKQKKKFLFNIDEKGFYFTPFSTGLPRFEGYPNIARFLDRYNENKSLMPIDYQDINVNASYLLVMIENYLNTFK
jgi:hypothetical protein